MWQPLGSKPMSLKEEKEYKKFCDNMYLDVEGTSDDPGPYWRTRYPWNIDRMELPDNYKAVHATMNSTARKLEKDPLWRKVYEEQLLDLTRNKFSREISMSELNVWKNQGKKAYFISHQMVQDSSNQSTPV